MEETSDVDVKPCLPLLQTATGAGSLNNLDSSSIEVKLEAALKNSTNDTNEAMQLGVEVKQEPLSPDEMSMAGELSKVERFGEGTSSQDLVHRLGSASARAVLNAGNLKLKRLHEPHQYGKQVSKKSRRHKRLKDAESEQQFFIEYSTSDNEDEEERERQREDEALKVHFESERLTEEVDLDAQIACAGANDVKVELDEDSSCIPTLGVLQPPGSKNIGTNSIFPPHLPRPSASEFFSNMAAVAPRALALSDVYMQVKVDQVPALRVQTPSEKLDYFKREHKCHANCPCSKVFCSFLTYTPSEIRHIDRVTATFGEPRNANWHRMKKQVFTASMFQTICSSTDFNQTASKINAQGSGDDVFLSRSISYERQNKNKALQMFLRSHRLRHKDFRLQKSGLLFSEQYPYLVASPDAKGICTCGQYLIFVKTLWKYRNYHPRIAAKLSGLLVEHQAGTFEIKFEHWHCRLQGEMGITAVHKAMLIIYTNKGVFPITILFNEKSWMDMAKKLETFYHFSFHPMLSSQN